MSEQNPKSPRGARPESELPEEEPLYTLRQLESLVGLGRLQLMRLIAAGELRSEKLLTRVGGAAHFVSRSELERFLEERRRTAAAAEQQRLPGRRPRIPGSPQTLAWRGKKAPALGVWLVQRLAEQGFRFTPSGSETRSVSLSASSSSSSCEESPENWSGRRPAEAAAAAGGDPVPAGPSGDWELAARELVSEGRVELRGAGLEVTVVLPEDDGVTLGVRALPGMKLPGAVSLLQGNRAVRVWQLTTDPAAETALLKIPAAELVDLQGSDSIWLQPATE